MFINNNTFLATYEVSDTGYAKIQNYTFASYKIRLFMSDGVNSYQHIESY